MHRRHGDGDLPAALTLPQPVLLCFPAAASEAVRQGGVIKVRFHSRVGDVMRELKRRKVFRVGSVYLVVAWGASVGAADLLPAFDVPDWGVRLFVIAAALGFPVALVLAWAYDLSSDGIRRDVPALHEASMGAGDATVMAGIAGDATVLAGTADSIRVSWDAGRGRQVQAFANNFFIGRDDACGVYLNDSMVSRRHARIFMEQGTWHIEDLGSRNGTRLDGEVITRAVLPPQSRVILYPGGPVLEVTIPRATR
jgi:hypothetical protein